MQNIYHIAHRKYTNAVYKGINPPILILFLSFKAKIYIQYQQHKMYHINLVHRHHIHNKNNQFIKMNYNSLPNLPEKPFTFLLKT